MAELIRPGDAGWDEARIAWNVAFDQQPAMVGLPANAAEVAEILTVAREAGLRVAVQAAGHNAGALGPVGDDTLLLKTARMSDARVDTDARRAQVGAAAKWQDVTPAASDAGLSPLVGSSAGVGIVGFTLGGGLGWLGRKYGLACNAVTRAEVVTADGSLLSTDADNEPDLFWALRGGGGSFAAVTSLEFELFPVPELYAGMFVWPWERTSDVFHAWREWISGQPDEISGCVRVLRLPPIDLIPEPFRGRDLAVVEAAYLGDQASGSELVQPLRELGPEMDTFQMVPPNTLGYLHMDPEDPVPALSGHQMLDDLSAEAVDALVEAAGPDTDSPLLSVEIRQLGGALAQAPPDAGALASLNQPYATYAVGMPTDPQVADAIVNQCQVVAEALKPWDAGTRYGNFTEAPTDSAMCYPPDTYERLQQVKAKYDPDDVFRSSHPIPCRAAA
jgi:FAD binding domain/Berberine and berberine like